MVCPAGVSLIGMNHSMYSCGCPHASTSRLAGQVQPMRSGSHHFAMLNLGLNIFEIRREC